MVSYSPFSLIKSGFVQLELLSRCFFLFFSQSELRATTGDSRRLGSLKLLEDWHLNMGITGRLKPLEWDTLDVQTQIRLWIDTTAFEVLEFRLQTSRKPFSILRRMANLQEPYSKFAGTTYIYIYTYYNNWLLNQWCPIDLPINQLIHSHFSYMVITHHF